MEAPELQLLFDTSRFDCDGLPSFNLIHPHPHGQPDPSQNLWNKAGAIEDIAVDKTLQSYCVKMLLQLCKNGCPLGKELGLCA